VLAGFVPFTVEALDEENSANALLLLFLRVIEATAAPCAPTDFGVVKNRMFLNEAPRDGFTASPKSVGAQGAAAAAFDVAWQVESRQA